MSRWREGQQQQWPEREEVEQQQSRPVGGKGRMRPSPSWPLHGKDRLILRIPAFQVSLQMQVALGSLASFLVSLGPSPQGGRPCVCLGGKGQDARKGVSKRSLLCPTHHILDSKSEIFLSCEPDSQPLLEERGGRHS